jgi:hypothetical protein
VAVAKKIPEVIFMKTSAILGVLFLLGVIMFAGQQSVPGQATARRTQEQMKALYDSHQGDFDYLLGDWQFTSVSKVYGKGQGFWSAVRLAEGAQVLDEYRVVSETGDETWYASSTIRSYNAVLDQWELISAETGTGLQNFGTAHRIGDEVHIEQKFGVMGTKPSVLRIRYYNIKPDSFSWTADRSMDGGKTWEKDHLSIEARRIGPARVLGALAPARKMAASKPANGGGQK